jgi:putative ABC transport system permease protein
MEARVFRAVRDEDLEEVTILVRTLGRSDAIVEPLRSTLSRLTREPRILSASTLFEASTGPLARLTGLAVGVAALVLALATVGLYGAVSFVAAQRTREIAIRLAVGASAPAVLRLVAREGVLVCAVGCAAGLALIAIAFRFMTGMIFASWTLEPFTIVGVLAVFSAATLAACYMPARRATRMDPMAVLRTE